MKYKFSNDVRKAVDEINATIKRIGDIRGLFKHFDGCNLTEFDDDAYFDFNRGDFTFTIYQRIGEDIKLDTNVNVFENDNYIGDYDFEKDEFNSMYEKEYLCA